MISAVAVIFELAIVRYNYRPIEYVRGLRKRQIIGYPVEVPTVFHLLDPDALEQESLSCHRQTHGSHTSGLGQLLPA